MEIKSLPYLLRNEIPVSNVFRDKTKKLHNNMQLYETIRLVSEE
jgi:hypothetical protein